MEARIARLESDISHLRSDVGEIRLDLRTLRDKIDGGIVQMHERADRQDARLGSLREDVASAKVWGLTLCMTLTGVMLTVMARGFGWV